MPQFTTTVQIAGRKLTITGDDFEEVFAAAAQAENLNASANYLAKQGVDPDNIQWHHNKAGDYEYLGVRDKFSRKNVTFGRSRDTERLVPFFPKFEEGYWDGEGEPDNQEE